MLQKLYLSVSVMVVALTSAVAFAPAAQAACPPADILGIPAWYRGLQDDKCEIKKPDQTDKGIGAFVTKIALNIVQAALMVAGYIAAFFVIKGGFYYMTSQGEASRIESAKKTITNAMIGLVIAMLSAAIVNAVAGIF